jgi:hypothetical protein
MAKEVQKVSAPTKKPVPTPENTIREQLRAKGYELEAFISRPGVAWWPREWNARVTKGGQTVKTFRFKWDARGPDAAYEAKFFEEHGADILAAAK